MPYSQAQKRATMKYRKESYARISLDLKKEKKEEYRAQAASHGMSLNAYIISLLEKDKADITAAPVPTPPAQAQAPATAAADVGPTAAE